MTAALDPGPTWTPPPRRGRAPRSPPRSRESAGVSPWERAFRVSQIDAEARTVTLQDESRAMRSPDLERAGTILSHVCPLPEGASNWASPEDRPLAIYRQFILLRDGETCGRCRVTFDELYQWYRARRRAEDFP